MNAEVRAAEAQVSADPDATAALEAPQAVPPASAIGGADYNGANQPDRA